MSPQHFPFEACSATHSLFPSSSVQSSSHISLPAPSRLHLSTNHSFNSSWTESHPSMLLLFRQGASNRIYIFPKRIYRTMPLQNTTEMMLIILSRGSNGNSVIPHSLGTATKLQSQNSTVPPETIRALPISPACYSYFSFRASCFSCSLTLRGRAGGRKMMIL